MGNRDDTPARFGAQHRPRSRSGRFLIHAAVLVSLAAAGCGTQAVKADIRKLEEAIQEVRRTTDNLILEQQALIAEMNDLEKGSGRPQELTAELEALKQKVSDINAELGKTSTTLREKQQLLTNHRSRFGTR